MRILNCDISREATSVYVNYIIKMRKVRMVSILYRSSILTVGALLGRLGV